MANMANMGLNTVKHVQTSENMAPKKKKEIARVQI